MAGYREHSFDPNAAPPGSYGPPMRPFNWLQWIGVALIVLGIGADLLFLAASAHLVPLNIKSPMLGTSPLVVGIVLINSRRQQVTDPAPELAADRRKWMAIVLAICAVVLGIGTIFAMNGY